MGGGFWEQCRREGTGCHTGWHSIYTTRQYLKSLNKIARVMTWFSTLCAPNSCYCSPPRPLETSSSYFTSLFHQLQRGFYITRMFMWREMHLKYALYLDSHSIKISFGSWLEKGCTFPFIFSDAVVVKKENNAGQSLCLPLLHSHSHIEYFSHAHYAGGLCAEYNRWARNSYTLSNSSQTRVWLNTSHSLLS